MEELVHLCCSVLEQSAVVWSRSFSEKDKIYLERTQKAFAKVALKINTPIMKLNLETLESRRQNFA